MKIFAHPLIDTMLNEEYRVFVNQTFNVDVFKNTFQGWSNNDDSVWGRYGNLYDKSTIEFFGDKIPYKITNPKLVGDKTYLFPFPQNLDQFICDCERCLLNLQWNDAVLSLFDRKHLMKQSELKLYFDQLLIKLEKE